MLDRGRDGGVRVLSAQPAEAESQLSSTVLADLIGDALGAIGQRPAA